MKLTPLGSELSKVGAGEMGTWFTLRSIGALGGEAEHI